MHPQGRLRELARKLWAPIAGARLPAPQVQDGASRSSSSSRSSRLRPRCSSRSLPTRGSGAGSSRSGFVLLLLVHEMGHVLELRRQGVPASAPLFIPFLGAVVGMKQMPKDAWQRGAGRSRGPDPRLPRRARRLDRGRGARLRVPRRARLYRVLPQSLQPPAGLPARRRARDGGRPSRVVGAGLAVLLGLVLVAPNPILIIILVLGGLEVWRRWRSATGRVERSTTACGHGSAGPWASPMSASPLCSPSP